MRNKKQRRKALLNDVSWGHQRYIRLTQAIQEHQTQIEIWQETMRQEEVSLVAFEEEIRKRLDHKNVSYKYCIDGHLVFQHP